MMLTTLFEWSVSISAIEYKSRQQTEMFSGILEAAAVEYTPLPITRHIRVKRRPRTCFVQYTPDPYIVFRVMPPKISEHEPLIR